MSKRSFSTSLPDDVISLTDDEDDQVRKAIRRSLEDNVRKKQRNSSRSSPDAVIDLLSDDDDNDEGDDGGGKLGPCDPTKWKVLPKVEVDLRSEGNASSTSGEVEIVTPQAPVLERFETEVASTASLSAASPGVTSNNTQDKNSNGKPTSSLSLANKDSDQTNDEIETLGRTNVLRLPHMRQHCPDHKFVEDVVYKRAATFIASSSSEVKEGNELNPKHCDLCYCYICDVPVKDCKNWTSEGNAEPNDHCLASDKGIDASSWKRRRYVKKSGQLSTTVASTMNSTSTRRRDDAISENLSEMMRFVRQMRTIQEPSNRSDVQNRLEGLYNARGNSSSSSPFASRVVERLMDTSKQGPFSPNQEKVAKACQATKCRKCRWYSRFAHKNFTRKKVVEHVHGRKDGRTEILDLNVTGDLDWCHSCGRIASERDFRKLQSHPYRPSAGDVLLGTKKIPFRIKSHDPRKMEKFKYRWASREGKSPEWTYDEAEMDQDTFNHRFGEYPVLAMIMASIPIVSEDNIPEDGDLTRDHDNVPYYLSENLNIRKASANETEAILLESRNHRLLLEELYKFNAVGNKKSDIGDANGFNFHRNGGDLALGGDIRAAWDKAKRKGTFKITVYLKSSAFVEWAGRKWLNQSFHCPASLSRFFGLWFDVLPFSLATLAPGMKARVKDRVSQRSSWRSYIVLPIPPWRLEDSQRESLRREVAEDENKAVDAFNASSKEYRSRYTFVSSTGTSTAGGICSNVTTFSGTLQRYFSETLFEDAVESKSSSMLSWTGRKLGIISGHRHMRRRQEQLPDCPCGHEPSLFQSYVREEDCVLLIENVGSSVLSVYKRTKTFAGLLQQLENLGHRPAPFLDGLNVQLLDFQRQAVGWAIERENTPGGVQSFLWTELPTGQDVKRKNSVYFSPVLDALSSKPPKRVRGGIIAEEMGLGKTVISLALVLQNPAPPFPTSGSQVAYADSTAAANRDVGTGWSPISGAEKGPLDPVSRGSIISRGTLVVCNVSLVGQWIDEAKSKLKDPGLVYSYHGGSRRRDPLVLAQNAIVVTTYATLASDATYHAKKAGPGYCPPCEQIRWWRIICDESHALRDPTTQISRALRSIIAENRWCVTGTPMNTSINDLKNQLKFIGLEHVDALFDVFRSTVEHLSPSNWRFRGDRRTPRFGNFLFAMRSLMMRHNMKQKVRADGKDLMSLPPKVERSITVSLSMDESAEYKKLENTARNFYKQLKIREGHNLSSHYFLMFQALMPLRMACAGGPVCEPKQDDEGGIIDKKKLYQMRHDDSTECSICLEQFDDPVATRCRPVPHVFCRDCLEGIIGMHDESNGPCPMCREEVKISSLRKAILPKPTIEGLSGEKGNDASNSFIFKSKFDRLLVELKRIRDGEPESKSLVFSQFASTLKWMQRELPKHGFQFRTLSGDMPMPKRAKALRDFQNDPPTTIFLLSTRAGAVGINLTQANRVFIMEPAVNPALEAQAIGRVHRLGQRKNVEVVRFFVRDSVETRLSKVVSKKFGEKQVRSDNDETPGSGEESSSRDSSSEEQPKSTVRDGDVIMGNIRSDKAAMMEEEFDLLFGLSDT